MFTTEELLLDNEKLNQLVESLKNQLKEVGIKIKILQESNKELTEACDLYRDELDNYKTTTAPEPVQPITLDAAQLLQLSADTLTERGKQYDSSGANKERSMSAVVKSFNTIYGTNLTEQQGWNFMVLLKMKRGADKPHKDSALDMIAYAALAGETVFSN
ncbi:DUF6378 domain-containing protein [uncultured Flavobacterium sp.]|uniref:DUF6378 domain-containing protein n=1 Tax=uncultured Flavobacterium sp. TaxID=165435 RepID=UPI0025991BEA|nr:DUF6378 domain-containing protein [uncultured Flavobacterium sp.]